MNKETWKSSRILQDVERLIVAGQIRSAQAELKTWARTTRKKAPEQLVKAAELARRVGLLNLALRMLNPVVRPKQSNPVPPSVAALTEYAASLVQIGARREGSELLSKVDSEAVPSRDLFLAFHYFAEWNYEAARPLLERYLGNMTLTPYQRQIGQLNLAAALVATGDNVVASTWLAKLKNDAPKVSLLMANVLEIESQMLISVGELAEARASLDQAAKLSSSFGGTYDLLVEKWRAVLALRKTKGSPGSVKQIRTIGKKAKEAGRWEVARDCEYQLALAQKNSEIAARLYFGTPFESYRRRLEIDIDPSLSSLARYNWRPRGRAGLWVTVESGASSGDFESLKPGQKPQRLLAALASDFYRPQRIGALFTVLCPGEFYSPDQAPQKVFQIVMRLREWFRRQHLPIEVTLESRNAELSFTAPVEIRVGARIDEPETAKLKASLQILNPHQWYSNFEIRSMLGLSARSVNRIVSSALAGGAIEKQGAGRACKYKLL